MKVSKKVAVIVSALLGAATYTVTQTSIDGTFKSILSAFVVFLAGLGVSPAQAPDSIFTDTYNE